jgi:hypothetical protein
MLKVHPDAGLRRATWSPRHPCELPRHGAFLDCREAIGAEFPHHFDRLQVVHGGRHRPCHDPVAPAEI